MAVDVEKQLDRAKRNLEKNKFEEAAENYQAILNEYPGHVDSLQALGDIYTHLGNTDQATSFYGILFDRFFDAREENKALAIYTRALKGLLQPPERMARYALLLQKQNRTDEAIEQYSQASELLLARGKEQMALDCLERVTQLDPENASRQFRVGELAERLGRAPIAARAFLRAGQIAESEGDLGAALELLQRAHQLAPKERTPALLYAQTLLRHGNPAASAQLLEPFAVSGKDTAVLSAFGDALMQIGDLERAIAVYERLTLEQPATASRLFEIVDRYLLANQDEAAVSALGRVQDLMVGARRENDFLSRLDALVESNSASIALAEFAASACGALNRESKYFEALVRLFDVYLAAGKVASACEAFDKLVDIDAYDSQNQHRLEQLAGQADPAFLTRMQGRLSQVATNTPEAPAAPASPAPTQRQLEVIASQQSLEDLIVQAEIFVQYSLQAKAIERLQKIAELFPGEEERNERLRSLCQLANWWPPGSNARPARGEAPPPANMPVPSPSSFTGESAETMRHLAKISEISQSLLRLPTARAILSAAINEMGSYLHASRCLAVVGPPGKPPQMASEFCAQGVDPAPGALLVRLLGQFERASPDALGGLPLDSAAAPVVREMGLETVLGVVLTDRETQRQAGMVVAGFAAQHTWRPSETYFLQAVGDQMLLSVGHLRMRAMARSSGMTDERTGLLARSAYQDCLLTETQRAKSKGTALALALIQIDAGPEMLRQQGEVQLELYVQQLARALESDIRSTDLAIKYTSWTIAFILPGTALAGAQALAEKLRKTGAQIRAPWNGQPLTLSASVAEAVTRADYDTEDIVTELVNRVEAGLAEAHDRGGDALVAGRILGS